MDCTSGGPADVIKYYLRSDISVNTITIYAEILAMTLIWRFGESNP